MVAQLRIAVVMIVVMTVITGLLPAGDDRYCQVLFKDKADGRWWSATGPWSGRSCSGRASPIPTLATHWQVISVGGHPPPGIAEDGTIISGGSNYGPTNQLLIDRVVADVAIVREENGLARTPRFRSTSSPRRPAASVPTSARPPPSCRSPELLVSGA